MHDDRLGGEDRRADFIMGPAMRLQLFAEHHGDQALFRLGDDGAGQAAVAGRHFHLADHKPGAQDDDLIAEVDHIFEFM